MSWGTNVLKIKEENHYYPFGLKHKNYNMDIRTYNRNNLGQIILPLVGDMSYKYKYNGKEWQDELGLNFYDYGARNYDPSLGRFFSIDRFAEKFENFTPYQYAGNTPTLFIDVNGEYIYINDPDNEGKQYRYQNGVTQHQVNGEWVEIDGNVVLSDFVCNTVAGLYALEHSGVTGKGLIDKFSGDKKDATFQYRKVDASKGVGNAADWKTGTVFFDHNYDQKSHTTSDYISNPHFVTIGHEMSHLTDPIKYHDTWYDPNVTQSEIRATHYENMIRAEAGLPLRTHYGSYMKGNNILPDARSTIIDKSGNSVYYNTATQRYKGQVTPTLINDGIRANNGVILNARFNYYGKR